MSFRPRRAFSLQGLYLRWSFMAVISLTLISCGGGSSASPPPQTQDFTLSPSSSALALQQLGSAVQYTIAIIPANGFNGSVSITFANLPAGVTITPAGPYSASPAQSLSVSFYAANAAIGNSTVTVQGSSGNHTHTTSLSLGVTAALSFQLSISPPNLSIGPNGIATAQLTLTPGSNFGSNSVYVTTPFFFVPNTGVSVSFSPAFLTAAQPQATFTFQAMFQGASATNVPVQITGTVGGEVVNVPFFLNIANPAPPCGNGSRSTIRRTDMDTTGVVYDPLRKQVFAAVQQTNTVQVFSSVDGHTIASIPVPEPRQLDITADGSRVLVGSLTRFLTWIDPSTLQVAGKIPVVTSLLNGSESPTPLTLVTLASGKVLVEMASGSAPFEWDPLTNTYTNPAPAALNAGFVALSRSADHSKVVAISIGDANALAVFDSASDSFGPVQNINAVAAALSPDGSRLAVLGSSPVIPGGFQILLFDSQFNTLATYQFNSQNVAGDLMFSRDGSLLYVFSDSIVVALNAGDLSFAGAVSGALNPSAEYPPDLDETGMFFIPGTGQRTTDFIDAGAPCALGIDDPYALALTPPQGTLTAPSPATLNAVSGLTSNSKVYFGAPPGSTQATPGTNLVYNLPGNIQVTPPSSAQSGAVNVTVTNPDGPVTIAPDAFTYGASVLALTPTSGPAGGGTAVTLFGYGFDFSQSQVQVTVAGNPAAVTSVFPGPPVSPFPFPMDQVKFTVPAGVPGAADIVLTTPAGSTTVSHGFHYLQSMQTFPVSATLAEIVYDQSRQRLYTSDYLLNKVDVFDLGTQQLLPSIPVGTSPLGMALSADSSTLVVANAGSSSISIVDLAGGTATRTVSLANLPTLPSNCGSTSPYAVATTSKGQAMIALNCANVTAGEFVLLDLTTEAIGCGASSGCAAMMALFTTNTSYVLGLSGTADGSKIFVANGFFGGYAGVWDVNADTFSSQPSFGLGIAAPAVVTAAASDGTDFAENFGILDSSIYESSIMQDVDYLGAGTNDVNSVPGEKLHPSGALLYVPQINGFDIYDSHHGHIARRVVLPLQVPGTFDALATDLAGSEVFLISSSGIAMVDVADLPLSLGSAIPAQGLASGGVSVKLRGSGFQNGATVMFGSANATVSFVDSSTLQVTTPSLPPGAARVTITNPDGTQYCLDNAYTAD